VHVGIGGAGGPLNRDGVSPVIVDKTVDLEENNEQNLADCAAALGE
jgi:hypothetical protein